VRLLRIAEMQYIRTSDAFDRKILPGPNNLGGEEGLHFDFKVEPDKQRDTAIDVAAFANSQGGALIFGVAEDAGRSGRAVAVNKSLDIAATRRHIEQALTEWAYGFDERPRPETLAVSGGTVVVVNVRPAGKLISIRARGGGTSIAYPFRHSHGNDYLKPEEVAWRMDTRRGYDTRAKIDAYMRRSTGVVPIELLYLPPQKGSLTGEPIPWIPKYGPPSITKLEPEGVTVTFGHGQRMPAPSGFTIPYSWIVSVWWNADKLGVLVAAWLVSKNGVIRGYPRRW